MDRKVCPVGQKYDFLLKRCISTERRASERLTERRRPPIVQVKSPSPAPQTSSVVQVKSPSPAPQTSSVVQVKSLSPAPQTSSMVQVKSTSPAPQTSSVVQVKSPSPAPQTSSVVQVKSPSPAPQTSPMILLSPALWICVVLVALGFILIVSMWIMIYRRHTKTSRTPDEKQRELVVESSQPTDTNRPCSAQLHPGARTGWEWGEHFTTCRYPTMHAGTWGEIELEHRVPLPATELGGTALVTTKTV